MSANEIANFIGWCTIFNAAILTLTTLVLVAGRKWIAAKHARWFGLSTDELSAAYFRYLATYKLMVIVFNLVPYVAMRMVLR